ncbi:phage antirepressor KilAC domain-containing protein [Criibacterium bergeronii]|uniref:Oxidoreductase n=1 Tax=Criibacterium bergeronii TaxID=1871336 RepID=A0A371IIX2_9FIRM|nr:phage antirepressor KilAC domain-containing protein [Criibacterium bergeronii]RDY20427.1 oxidoreductase [Criibacterium bergeronii]
MNELIKVDTNEKGEVIVSGRELHKFLELGTDYKKWFDRMIEYGFTESVDFATVSQKCLIANGGYQEKIDHAIKLDMAKELAMIQRNEKGKQARQYFISVEKEFNSPEKIMARALRIADETIAKLTTSIKTKDEQLQLQKPKVLFAETVETSESSILVGELSKYLKQKGVDIGQNRLFGWLRDNGYLIKQKGENYNLPTQYSMDLGVMEVKKRTINNPDGSIRTTSTPKVTGKGQIYFVNKFLSEVACV